MPTRRPRATRRGAALAATGIALVLAGCAGTAAPTVTASPEDTPAPIFATDEEALAAAVEAYEQYSAASAAVASDGGKDAARVDSTVTPRFARTLHEEFAALEEAGLRMVGATEISGANLVENSTDSEGAKVTIYLCRDVSSVRVVAADGTDVTPSDRDESAPAQVFLVSSANTPEMLLVDGVDKWSGTDFC